MSYCVAADIEGLIPPEWLTEALDDAGTGERTALADVLQAADDEIDAKLAGRYALPLDLSNTINGIAAKLRHMARYLAAEIAYGRRGLHERFPWKEQMKQVRKALDAIEAGDLPLFPTLAPVADEAVAITVANPAHSAKLSF